MKYFLSIMLCVPLVLALAGCSGSSSKSDSDSPSEPIQEQQNTPTDKSSETTPTDEKAEEEAAITVGNSSEFSTILKKKDEFDPSFSTFAEEHKGDIVEFDGCITYVANYDQYKTRYDILLSAGDYVNADTANPGPIFKFENVNTHDLGIKDLYLPDFINEGNDVHIEAEIVRFDSNKGLFYLDPVLIEKR